MTKHDLISAALGIIAGAILCYCLNLAAEWYAYQEHLAALAMGAN